MDILKRHAIDNIWCEPNQDSQNIFQVDRLTAERGVLNKAPVIWNSVKMPKESGISRFFYHLYQIGKLDNSVLNINMVTNKWYSATEICNLNKEVVDVYFDNGCMIPRDIVYLMVLPNSNFIMAIEILPNLDMGKETVVSTTSGEMYERSISLDFHNPIIRFYNNGRFSTPEFIGSGSNITNPIRAIGKYVSYMNDFNSLRSDITSIKNTMNNKGKYLYWMDGYIVNEPTVYNTSFGNKYHYFIWDSSIKNIDFIPISELVSFTSKVDMNTRKYACVLNTDYKTIDYQDDIDFYLVKKTGSNYKGVLIPRLNRKNIRQITHNAYSIRSDVLNDLSNSHKDLKDFNNLHIMAIVRQGGFKRGLVHQKNRINELYRLPRNQILEALSGVNSLVPEWKAENLESSAYTTIMRSSVKEINETMLKEAYGYNASNLYLEKSSHDIVSNDLPYGVNLPLGFAQYDSFGQGNRAVFCYDSNGLLLGYYQDKETVETLILSSQYRLITKHIEAYHAEVSSSDNVIYTNSTYTSPQLKEWGFRVYAIQRDNNGNIIGKWKDITNTNFYSFNKDTNTINFNNSLLSQSKLLTAIKLNKYVTVQEFKTDDIRFYRGYHSVTISTEKSFDGTIKDGVDTIPPGQLDVFLNGYSLIEGLDYFIKWPTIYISRISSKRNTPTEDKILVRMRGFCDKSTMQPTNFRDIGFLEGSIASVNNRFDVRNDRNSRIIIGGKIYSRNNVAFAEESTETSGIQDGLPYAVSDHWGNTESYLNISSLDYREESLDIDKRVGDYLTSRLKTTVPEHNFIIVERWEVISLFISSIINDIKNNGFLIDYVRTGAYDKLQIETLLSNYMHLLNVDPCVLNPNSDFILFLPHQYNYTLSVSQDQYALLEYLIKEYLNNLIDLTPYLTIGN